MVVDLNQPKKPIGMHVPTSGQPKTFWTGKVAIGLMYNQTTGLAALDMENTQHMKPVVAQLTNPTN